MERLESEGETVPIMYFPNKPHKEGLLIYQWMRRHLSTMEKNIPTSLTCFLTWNLQWSPLKTLFEE